MNRTFSTILPRSGILLTSLYFIGGAACSSLSSSSAVNLGDAGKGTQKTSTGRLNADGASDTCTTEGCACGAVGSTASCWSGPTDTRGLGSCRDGTTTCHASGEFGQWGPCVGEVLDCALEVKADAGGDAAGLRTASADAGNTTGDAGNLRTTSLDAGGKGKVLEASVPPMCATPLMGGTGTAGGITMAPPCVSGSSRWCDDGSCYWGQQTCQSDGTWGDCNDTTDNAGPSGCSAGGINYDENCCVQSGQCCAHAVDGSNYGSVGTCDQIDMCACQQLCAAGATRWCSDDSTNAGGWGQQQCGATGTWGSCVSTTLVPSGCTSGTTFDQNCCIASGGCCEAFDSEGADPISFNCPATTCSTQWSSAGDYDAGDYFSSTDPGGLTPNVRGTHSGRLHLPKP